MVRQAAAQRVDEHLLGYRPHDLIALAEQRFPESLRTVNGEATERNLGVDRRSAIGLAQLADCIVVLQGEAQRIHLRVAARARRAVPVLFHSLAEAQRLALTVVLLERGD